MIGGYSQINNNSRFTKTQSKEITEKVSRDTRPSIFTEKE